MSLSLVNVYSGQISVANTVRSVEPSDSPFQYSSSYHYGQIQLYTDETTEYNSEWVKVTYTCNDGYRFVSYSNKATLRIYGYNARLSSVIYSQYFTETDDSTKYVKHFILPNFPYSVNGEWVYRWYTSLSLLSTEEDTVETFDVDYNNTLTNFSIVNNPSSFTVGESSVISVKNDYGTIVTTIPVITIKDGETIVVSSEMELNNGNYEYSFTPSSKLTNCVIEIVATAEKITTVDIGYNTDNLIGFDFKNKPLTCEVGNYYTIKIDKLSSYILKTAPTITITYTNSSDELVYIRNNVEMSQGDDGYYNTNLLTEYVENLTVTLSGECVDPSTWKYSFTVNSQLVGYSLTEQPTILQNTVANRFVVDFSEGYNLNVSTPHISISSTREETTVNWFENDFNYDSSSNQFYIDVYPNFQTENVTNTIVTITGESMELTENASINPFVRVYLMPYITLNELADLRFYTLNNEEVDLTTFINKIFKLYVPVDVTKDVSILAGKIDTGLKAPTVKNLYTHSKSNDFTIAEKYNNSFDYNSEVYIYLPFYGMLQLNTRMVLGKVLHLEYVVNNLNGICDIYLYENDSILYNVSCNMLLETPINGTENYLQNISNNIQIGENSYNLIPYVIVNRNIKNDEFNTFNNADYLTTLENISGYCEGDFYKLEVDNSFITQTEKNNISQLLSTGIIV